MNALTNHLWQSTLFACAAGLLAFAFRTSRAKVRYWLWFSASVKFLVPFALLMSVGSRMAWAPAAQRIPAPSVSATVLQISEPFPAAPGGGPGHWLEWTILGVWFLGFASVAQMRLRGWLRVRTAIRASSPMDSPAGVEVRTAPGLLEPGVVGWINPILLLPEGIAERLTPGQLRAVLAHELCHVRRRDNLLSAIHMAVEAIFWFHPLVWWIGGRLVEERERACDEEVLRLGGEPDVYAEAILTVCRHYLESPLVCVSGISGSNLKRRVQAILAGRLGGELTTARKAALAAAFTLAVAAPIVVGMLHAPALHAQPKPPVASAPPVDPPAPAPQAVSAPRTVAPSPTPPALEDVNARMAYAKENFGSPFSAKARIYIGYGAPDQIDHRGNDFQEPSEVWRYTYLPEFRSGVEFEFRKGASAAKINWPPPLATYQGEAGSAGKLPEVLGQLLQSRGETVSTDTTAGLPGRQASFLIYPAATGSILSVPLDSFSGKIDLIAQIRQQPASGETGPHVPHPIVANLRDMVDASAGTYQSAFNLAPGSYDCQLLVREKATGKMYTETIQFEVK